MGSRVVGFRVPDDLAEELERVSDERGQTTAEFLRKLVDDALYPSRGSQIALLKEKDIDTQELAGNVATLNEEVDAHDDKLTELENQFDGYDRERAKIADELKGLAQSLRGWGQQVDALTGIDNEKLGKLSDVEDSVTKLQDVLSGRVTKLEDDMVARVAELENKLKQKIAMLETSLKESSTKVTKLEDMVKNDRKRLPASAKYRKIKLTDKTEHHYILYRMPWGLTQPLKIEDDEYIDLGEPFD